MRKLLTFLLLILILILGCKKDTRAKKNDEVKGEIVKDNQSKNVKILTDTPAYYDYSNTILKEKISDTVYAKFSQDSFDDCFILNVENGKITETKARIRVLDTSGKIIYEHVFPTRAFVNGYETVTIKTEAEMEKYIINQANKILNGSILNPNLLSKDHYLNQSPKEEFEDYDVFNEIKNSNRAIFMYGLEEENLYYLGFSKKKNKTVTIINCC